MNNTELDVNDCIYFRLGYDTVSGRILAVTDNRRAVEVTRKNNARNPQRSGCSPSGNSKKTATFGMAVTLKGWPKHFKNARGGN